MDLVSLLNLIGALGLFLYGMKVMSDALMSIAGHRMRILMVKLTANRFKGALTGFAITALVQSSSATTLMVVSFVNAQLLSLSEAIAVMMGANVGTTITAWLITIFGFKVKMNTIAIPMMMVGFIFYMSKKSQLHYWGKFIIGFALLFLGLQFMKDAVPDLEQSPHLYQFFIAVASEGFLGILIFVLIGAVLTVILQSSSASMAITLVAAAQGILDFSAAAAMVLGGNIGTTVTANLAALVAGVQAKRTALAHFLFNIIGVLWVIVVFYYFLDLVEMASDYIWGAKPLQNAADIPVGLSIFHTAFNVINTVALIGFIALLVKLVTRLIPEKAELTLEYSTPKFLSSSSLAYPETAIHMLLRECRRLYRKTVFEAVTHALNLHRDEVISSLSPLEVAQKSSKNIPIEIDSFIVKRVKPIYSAVLEFASQILEKLELTEAQRNAVIKLKQVVRDILHILRNAALFRHELAKYIDSDNEAMKLELNNMRAQIIAVLRGYHDWKPDNSIKKRKRYIKRLKEEAEKRDTEVITNVDHLIRTQQITAEMGTSLISCSSYILHIIERLNFAVKTLSYVADEYDDVEKLLLEKHEGEKVADNL